SSQGMVALVTGGASGLGKATVERLVAQGARVVLLDLATSKGAQVAKDLGQSCSFAPANVRTAEEVRGALALTQKTFGRLDLVVNCAGVAIPCRTYNKKTDKIHELEEFQKVINVNLVGTFNVIRLCAQLMAQNSPDPDGHRGLVVNTASVAAFEGQVRASAGCFWSQQGGI
ncbi:HCD2 dehydrogenase, partial [Rhinopomastus cyanomelas]|nr:HCD2 dehydrogenase [Rhinopomastus cyanomelas]